MFDDVVLPALSSTATKCMSFLGGGALRRIRERVARGSLQEKFSLVVSALRAAISCWRSCQCGVSAGSRVQASAFMLAVAQKTWCGTPAKDLE
jgi:hypothetical protein